MARLARVVAAGIAHHVTQRGNARRFLLDCDADRQVYLQLLQENAESCGIAIAGYCLMSSHVHLVLVPGRKESLGRALKHTHGRYAAYWNALYRSSGHVWQGRYYSCPLDNTHVWQALRYTELNPVRAGMAADASSWKWSSAALHCGKALPDGTVDLSMWRRAWTELTWQRVLGETEEPSDIAELRRCTFSGRPLGCAAFLEALENKSGRKLAPKKPTKLETLVNDQRQAKLEFAKQNR